MFVTSVFVQAFISIQQTPDLPPTYVTVILLWNSCAGRMSLCKTPPRSGPMERNPPTMEAMKLEHSHPQTDSLEEREKRASSIRLPSIYLSIHLSIYVSSSVYILHVIIMFMFATIFIFTSRFLFIFIKLRDQPNRRSSTGLARIRGSRQPPLSAKHCLPRARV